MIALRSLLYNVALYLSTFVQMIVFTPFYFLVERRRAWFVPKFWGNSNVWLLRVICGTTHRIESVEKIPQGPCIIAPKHQSFWDTFALLRHFGDVVIILKRQLLFIPLFGLYLARMNFIAIKRGERRKVLAEVTRRAREEVLGNGRQLLIYPEGTRRAPGDEPHYKYGVTHLYLELGVPVIPIAMNPGLFWPRRRFRRYPGTIHVRVLDPIEPGLSKDEFMALIVERMETAQDELLLKQAREPVIPPFVPTARARVEALTGQTLEEYRTSLGLRPDSPYRMGGRGAA